MSPRGNPGRLVHKAALLACLLPILSSAIPASSAIAASPDPTAAPTLETKGGKSPGARAQCPSEHRSHRWLGYLGAPVMSGPIAFVDTGYYTGPSVTQAMIDEAGQRLGVRLPASYLDLLGVHNGGQPVRRCCPTAFPTSWARDHIAIEAIRGIGGTEGIDVPGPGSSVSLIEEWGYPPVGVVICDTPSGGHDTVMLDYTVDAAEPAVVYVDEDRVPRRLADSFADFLAMLFECPEY